MKTYQKVTRHSFNTKYLSASAKNLNFKHDLVFKLQEKTKQIYWIT